MSVTERKRAQALLTELGISESRREVYGRGIDKLDDATLAAASDALERSLDQAPDALKLAEQVLERQRDLVREQPSVPVVQPPPAVRDESYMVASVSLREAPDVLKLAEQVLQQQRDLVREQSPVMQRLLAVRDEYVRGHPVEGVVSAVLAIAYLALCSAVAVGVTLVLTVLCAWDGSLLAVLAGLIAFIATVFGTLKFLIQASAAIHRWAVGIQRKADESRSAATPRAP